MFSFVGFEFLEEITTREREGGWFCEMKISFRLVLVFVEEEGVSVIFQHDEKTSTWDLFNGADKYDYLILKIRYYYFSIIKLSLFF